MISRHSHGSNPSNYLVILKQRRRFSLYSLQPSRHCPPRQSRIDTEVLALITILNKGCPEHTFAKCNIKSWSYQ